MYDEIKTLNGWREYSCRTGKESIYDYLNKGDIVSKDLVDNLKDMLPLRAMSNGYLQVGEPYNYVYDIARKLRPTFMTFAEHNNHWRYYGNCVAWETVDKTYY